MNIDPKDLDEQVRQELDQELTELGPDDLERMSERQPESRTDERGRIRGRILEVRGPTVYIDIGGKSEAFLPLDEFAEDQPPQPGQELEFVMHGIEADSGLMRLSLREVRIDADLDSLSVGDVVEARVTGVNMGGLELNTNGIRAFMPKSQVELERIEDFTPYISRRLECQITEIDRKGRTLVVSRRKILERDRQQAREELKFSMAEGQVRQGVVRRLTDFGAFVDLGGIDGLLHVSDLSYGRVKHPKDVVKIGDRVDVKILKIDLVRDRISLGLKQLTPDPWEGVPGKYRVGDTVEGRVLLLQNFGAFVELEPGVEALIPVSEMSWAQRIHHPKDLLSENTNVRCSIIAVDPNERKMTLSLKALSEDPWKDVEQRYTPDSTVSGRVTRLVDFGAFVQLEEGVEGLVHISEMSDKRVRSPGDVVKEGDVIEVRIKGVDPQQRRISLSMKLQPAAQDAGHAEPVAAEAARSDRPRRKKSLKGGLDF